MKMTRNRVQLALITVLTAAVIALVVSRPFSESTTPTTTIPAETVNFNLESCQMKEPKGYIQPFFEVKFRASSTDGRSRVGRYYWVAMDRDGNVFATQAAGWSLPFRVNPAESEIQMVTLYMEDGVDLQTFRAAMAKDSVRCRVRWDE